jgi:hypothetical protein
MESGRPDSNRRSQAPRACGLARLSHALIVGRGAGSLEADGRPIAPSNDEARWFSTPGLETPRGVQDRPDVNSVGHAADGDSPDVRRGASHPDNPDCVERLRHSSQPRPRGESQSGSIATSGPHQPLTSCLVPDRRRPLAGCSREVGGFLVRFFGWSRDCDPGVEHPASQRPATEEDEVQNTR